MGNLPSGTVTFLFTDIEGSTKLAQSLGDRWETIRARHHEILKSAIESNNGYVFQIIGDAFCASFHNAGDALQASTQAQTDLQNGKREDAPIRVRMGVHTGKAEVQEDGPYQGYLALSLVQRIMSAGHGGQLLISGATEYLVRGQLPGGIDLIDLGRHTFKGVNHAVRVFQVDAPDLQSDFPPLRTFDILPNNLPTQLTSFVGRQKELADVKRLLKDTHMLTLIGTGGTGKTRLSIQAANEMLSQYPDGVWLVDLAPILDPLLVPRTTAITIGLRFESQRPVIDMLCDYLSKKKMLIILDNCEHLVDACAQMSNRILRAAPEVQILASSREALSIAGEVTYRVPSLGLPDVDNLPSVESLSQYEAVKLFIDRATAAIPDFKVTNENAPALAQICHRLDGIPLAIELAAGKIRVLGVEQISKRLDDRFKLLTSSSRTAMERHQTLRATVDWSYNLLPSEEQTSFRRLAVFRGGWTLEAVESICGGESGSSSVRSDDVLDLLEQLINKSLVITEDEGGTIRYHMLETIRQYANEKLVDSGESEALHEKHLEFFLKLAETAEPHLIRHEQLEWFAQLEADHENLRAALEWSLEEESAEQALRLCAAIGKFWSIRGYWKEGSKWFDRALKIQTKDQNLDESTARARVLYLDANLAFQLDDHERMKSSAEMSLTLADKLGDRRDIAIAMFYKGYALWRLNKNDKAQPLMEQSLAVFRELNEPYWEAYSFRHLGFLIEEYDFSKREKQRLQALGLARKAGERLLLAEILSDLSYTFYSFNRLDESSLYAKEADKYFKQVGAKNNSAHQRLANIAWAKGDYEQAESLLGESRDQLGLLGEKNSRMIVTAELGLLAQERGHLEKAKLFFEEVLEVSRELNSLESTAYSLVILSNKNYLDSDEERGRCYLLEAVQIIRSLSEYEYVKIHFFLVGSYSLRGYDPKISAFLLGVLDSAEKDKICLITPVEHRAYDDTASYDRKILGDEAFESAFAEGQRMLLDDALDLVLKVAGEIE